jgi:hypothetical protein
MKQDTKNKAHQIKDGLWGVLKVKSLNTLLRKSYAFKVQLFYII